MSRFVDFDRMYAELNRDTIRMRVMGEDVEIGASVPASVVMLLMRFEEQDSVPASALLDAGAKLFGAARIEKWAREPRFSVDMLAELLKAAFEAIGGAGVEGGAGDDKQTGVCITEDGSTSPAGAGKN